MTKAQTYIQAVKSKPGLILHLVLFAIMCWLAWGVWNSLEKVFPEGLDLGEKAIIARLACIGVLIFMTVRATPKIVRYSLVLIVIATVLEVGEFGCHWLYARELSTARMHQAEVDRQKVFQNKLDNEQTDRATQVLEALTAYNQSQAKLTQADTTFFQRTGVRVQRKTAPPPSLEGLGLTPKATPTPTPTPDALMSSALGATKTKTEAEMPVILNDAQVLAKWTPRFVTAAILCLVFVFVGTSALAARWEWDFNGNGIPDGEEGK